MAPSANVEKFKIMKSVSSLRRRTRSDSLNTWVGCFLLMIGTAGVVPGCGRDGAQPVDVSGKVTFGGETVMFGLLEFIPDSSRGHKGPAGSAEIVDGQFTTRGSGKGVIPGPHLVRVTGYDKKPASGLGDDTVITKADAPLFLMFTIPVEKVAATCDLDVPASAKGYGVAPVGRGGRVVAP